MAKRTSKRTKNEESRFRIAQLAAEWRKKNPWWRPNKFKSWEELFDTFIWYCEQQVKYKRPITKKSFLAHLLISRKRLFDNKTEEKFSDTVKAIDQICEAYAEEELFCWKNVAGVIFNLTNNYGEYRKQKQHNTHANDKDSPLFDAIEVTVIWWGDDD